MSHATESSPEKGHVVFDEHEKRILEAQLEPGTSNAGFFGIFRFATTIDVLYILASIFACGIGGVSVPLMMAVLGSLAGNFSGNLSTPGAGSDFIRTVDHNVLYFVYIGVAQLVLVSAGMYGLNMTGSRITNRLREAFLKAVLRQNVAFFDSIGAGEIAVRMSNDMNLVQDGISQKIGIIASGVAGFFAAIILSFIYNWRMALVLLCIPALIIIIMGGCGATMRGFQEKATAEYARTSSFAEEIISCIRNVVAFGSQSRLLKSYKKSLDSPERADFVAQGILGVMLCALFTVINLAYGLAFWQGNRFLVKGQVTVGQLITVMFSMAIAGTLLGQAIPHVAAIVQAGAAASRIFATIERQSPIDSTAGSGHIPEDVNGTIQFRGVKMIYPSRQDQTILDDFNLTIPAAKTIAIVGPSGSGKTTLVSLLERLYLPLRGEITLDGISIADLNLRWLRSQIGIVAQDNFLFDTSIYENIAYGLGPRYNTLDPQATRKQVEEAARIAHAHEFIQGFPEGYDTSVGHRGSHLSGGQRQRIAIARAIIAQPKILMLDEATAALDTENERLVQDALFSAALGRTTIIIAHRLSTIRRADMIVVMDKGKVTESGTHEQLMASQATYATLVKAQQLRQDTNEDAEEVVTLVTGPKNAYNKPSVAIEIDAAKHVAQERLRNNSFGNLVRLVWRLNASEKYHLIAGLICSIIAGTAYPISGIFFGNAIVALTDSELANGGHSINFWCLMFLMFGIILMFAYGIQGWTFALAGARLGSRARKEAFAAILRQDISFFERDENSPGILAAFLSIEATKLRGIGGATLGAVANSVMSLVGGVAVSVAFGWKLGLVGTACMPILLLCGFLRFWVVSRAEARVKRTTTAAAKAAEAVSAIPTVAALTMEETVIRKYAEHVTTDEVRSDLLFDIGVAMTYALSMALVQFVNALIFWYGGAILIGGGEYTIRQFFICYASSVFSAQGSGAIFSFAPEIAGAQEAAANLKHLLDSTPVIENTRMDYQPHEKDDIFHGEVKLRNVGFAYPLEEEHPVLMDVNLEAQRGQMIALIGSSGSGKSTVISLLERFYDPTSGAILIDQKDLRQLDLSAYRKQVALVEQESPLVGDTIRDCLLSDDEAVSDGEIEQACREANIGEFLTSLPEGLNTLVGARGNRVSGGQKQRLAIAKALLRNPKLLLLDEATSALDSTSEKLVQSALESATTGRTTVAISHRLSSITHADCIYVFNHGQIVEHGTHEELLAKKGRYFELVALQDLGR